MSKEISLFSDYHTKENSLTNHCGLILKLLYEENPTSFEEAISSMTSTNFVINPTFEQQVRKETSVCEYDSRATCDKSRNQEKLYLKN
jgi:hypothetical protein